MIARIPPQTKVEPLENVACKITTTNLAGAGTKSITSGYLYGLGGNVSFQSGSSPLLTTESGVLVLSSAK